MSDAADMGYPLEGIRVLDLTRVLAGPYCARLLSDMGADVVKVEPPTADITRGIGKRVHGISGYYAQQNAGKRNVCIDLDKPEGMALILEMVAKVDILLDNFRPGVMDRRGLTEEVLLDKNPRLIHGMISGFGQDSPAQDKRALASVIQAMSGFTDSQARADKRGPIDSAHAVADTSTGVHACNAILAALYQRERTGRGQTVDIAMHDVMLSMNETVGGHLFEMPDAINTHYRGLILEGADGFMAYQGDPVFKFEPLLKAIERPDLADDPRFATPQLRNDNSEIIFEAVAAWVTTQPSIAEVERKLDAAGHPNGPVRTVAEALVSPEATARGMVVEVDDRAGGTARILNTPARFSRAKSGLRGVAGYRGEHNHQVLRELLGYDDSKIEALENEGVVIKTRKKK